MENQQFLGYIDSENVYTKRFSHDTLLKLMKEFSKRELLGFQYSINDEAIPLNGYSISNKYDADFNDRRIIGTLGSAIREFYFDEEIRMESGTYIDFIGTFWIILWNSLVDNIDVFNKYFVNPTQLIQNYEKNIIN